MHATHAAGVALLQKEFQRRSSWTPRGSVCMAQIAPQGLYDCQTRKSSIYSEQQRSLVGTASAATSQVSLFPSRPTSRLYSSRASFVSDDGVRISVAPSPTDDRIRISIRGAKFETYRSTLEQFPETLLGSPGGRDRYYDQARDELVFNDRDPASFDAILFFYQSKGKILSRPESVDEHIFTEEMKFYGILDEEDDQETEISTPTRGSAYTGRCGYIRNEIWHALEHPSKSKCGKIIARVSMFVIVLSVIAFCLDTVPEFGGNSLELKVDQMDQENSTRGENTTDAQNENEAHRRATWFTIDTIFVIFFTLEYLIRLFAAPNRLRFFRSFLALVDFIAIAPYYISLMVTDGRLQNVKSFNVVRAVRLFRVVRLFKLYRYSDALQLLGRALLQSKEKMGTLILCVLMAAVLFSSALYYVEGFEKEHSEFQSIPSSFWWAIVTMSTVGYGDIVPVTALGKLIAAFCAFTGIILLYILPIPVFVTHFSKIYEKWRNKRRGKDNGIGLKFKLTLW